jgi:hypothetical protein
MSITQLRIPRHPRRAAAGVAAAVALGGLLGACGSSDTTATKTGAAATPTAGAPSGAQGAPAGLGKEVTGAAAAKAKAAALAKDPGTAERVMQLADGSYVVHVLRSSGEVHVRVSKTFAVTGTEQGPTGGAPPAGLGTVVTGTAAAKAKAAALAKDPGTAERVMQLADGSYVVHVLRGSAGEVHVKVSKTFAVTGTEQAPASPARSAA